MDLLLLHSLTHSLATDPAACSLFLLLVGMLWMEPDSAPTLVVTVFSTKMTSNKPKWTSMDFSSCTAWEWGRPKQHCQRIKRSCADLRNLIHQQRLANCATIMSANHGSNEDEEFQASSPSSVAGMLLTPHDWPGRQSRRFKAGATVFRHKNTR